ncbi:tail fiber domain-containing protein [Bradyrhizobium sp. Pa8]|uniref:tail fiber domain-containing protein n=1 Tax=Bradyrhizobium sp. Pa8 TaxID=3386552 RepID=UPI00403FB02E
MSIFDIFDNSVAQDAANAQIAGINTGVSKATENINQGIGAINTNYTNALQPYLTNYSNANAGVDQLKNLLGLNGQQGADAAMKSLEATPGYKFQLQQGNNSINAAAAANGTLASGKQLIDLSNYNQGLASTSYQNAVNNLMPFLSGSQTAAGGIAGTYTGLGNATAGQYNNLANLNYTGATGIGNANANAILAENQANENQWGLLSGLASAGSKVLGSSGGLSGLAGALSVFSDENLKENIEPVGKLYDGTNIYRYNYIGSLIPHIGVMAQEVERDRPEAVTEIAGFKAVNYAKATDRAASLARFLEAA